MADTGLCFAEIKDCLFDRCNAKMLVAEEAAISNTAFENCNMSKAYFTHSEFDKTRFVGCDMEGSSFQNAFGGLDIIPERENPKCKLVGSDGNIFVLLGIASSALKKNGQREDAENMRERVYASGSYYEALGIITEYYTIFSGDCRGVCQQGRFVPSSILWEELNRKSTFQRETFTD